MASVNALSDTSLCQIPFVSELIGLCGRVMKENGSVYRHTPVVKRKTFAWQAADICTMFKNSGDFILGDQIKL